eukprot:s1359_g7.t1
MAEVCGQKKEEAAAVPFVFASAAQPLWNEYARRAERLVGDVPRHVKPTVGKHFFTVGSTAFLYHLYARVCERLQCGEELVLPEQRGVETWYQMDEAVVACAPAWLWHFAYSVLVIRNEMSLPPEQRADPPVQLQELNPGGRDPLLSDLSELLQRHGSKEYITVSDLCSLSRRYRGNQEAQKQIFDLAVQHHAGELSGQAHRGSGRNFDPWKLRLTLHKMSAESRQTLRIVCGGHFVGEQSLSPKRSHTGLELLDLGGQWGNKRNACFPLHLAAAVAWSALPVKSRSRLLTEVRKLLVLHALPLDITPAPSGHPASLQKVGEMLRQCGAAILVHYWVSFDGSPLHVCQIGAKDPDYFLCPIVVGVRESHCCLMHGDFAVGSPKKKPAAAYKRPAGVPADFTLTGGGSHDGLPWTRKILLTKLREWARSTRAKPTTISVSQNDKNRGSYYYRFRCISCVSCGWHGVAEYDWELKEYKFKATAVSTHTDRGRHWGSGGSGLTQVSKDIIRESVHKLGGKVLRMAPALDGPVPSEQKVRNFLKNLWSRDTTLREARGNSKGGRPQAGVWTTADFELLQQTWPTIQDPNLDEDKLTLVNCHLGDEHVCISFCIPRLTKRHWQLLENKVYVKVCTDGMYRLCNQSCAICFFGVLGKQIKSQREKNEGRSVQTFPTSFRELMVSIVSTEHSTTYGRLFGDVDEMMRTLCDVGDFKSLVKQCHGDFHAGLQIARESHYRHAVFAGDFAHAIGATRVKKQEKGLAAESDYPWRSGLFTVVRKALSNESWLDTVQHAVHTSRSTPWPIFHAIWTQLLTALDQAGETSAVQKLETYYVHTTPSGQYRAHWAAGSLQPGSYCGSQPQELGS